MKRGGIEERRGEEGGEGGGIGKRNVKKRGGWSR